MSNPSWEVQTKLVSLLKLNADIQNLVSDRIYNDIPESPEYPCLILESLTENDNSADCVDLYQEFFTLMVWSKYRGQKEVKDLAVKIKRLLKNKSFILDDGQPIDIEFTHISYPKMNDDAMSGALLEFNFYYEDLED